MRRYPDVLLRKATSGKFDHYVVVEEFGHQGIVVPAGYQSDFASVPRLLWPLFPPHGRLALPSIVHDYFYDHRLFRDELGDSKARKLADHIFLIDMINANVPIWQAVTVYTFVRLFGRAWWDN